MSEPDTTSPTEPPASESRVRRQLMVAAGCLAAFAVIAFLVIAQWGPLHDLDMAVKPSGNGAGDQPVIGAFLRVVEVAFGTVGMTILTVVMAIVLLVKGHPRAALLSVLVMLITSLATTALKLSIGRARPEWQYSVDVLTSKSFPSGHASAIAAFCGLLGLFSWYFSRRASMKRFHTVLLAGLVLLVCADRILLGRHYPSDVVAGVLLGVAVLLIGASLYSPEPTGHATAAQPLAEVMPSEHRLAVVLNPIKVDDVEEFRRIVTSMAVAAGWQEPTWHYTRIEDPGTGMAHAARDAGADMVIVCGGDGTVREVCAALAGTGIPVGIVPAGTGNLLARNLHLPLYQRSALDVALNGQDRAVDMVAVSGDDIESTHFMVMAGMGFDAAIMEGVNDDLKKRIGWIAYVVSGAKSLMFPPVKVEISVDGGEWTKHRARTLVVGNVGFLQGNMPLLPDAVIDDGKLDVVLLHPAKFINWVPIVWRIMARRQTVDSTLYRQTGQRVSVRAATETPRQLDGDPVGAGKQLDMECIHGRVLVRVPR